MFIDDGNKCFKHQFKASMKTIFIHTATYLCEVLGGVLCYASQRRVNYHTICTLAC